MSIAANRLSITMRIVIKQFFLNLTIIIFGFIVAGNTVADSGDAPSSNTKTVLFKSKPAGARVYERKKGTLVSIGRTPCKISIKFASGTQAKKYYFRKIGYKSTSVTSKRTDNIVQLQLVKSKIFDETNQKNSAKFQKVREKIIHLLSKKIYESSTSFDDSGFDLVGRIGALELTDGYYVGLGILLDDTFKQTELRPIRRIRNREKREEALVNSVLKYAGGKLLVQLSKELNGISELEGIVLNINYRKTKSVLGEDIDRFTVHKSWQWELGTTIYQKHLIYTQDVERTTVEDIVDLYRVIIKIKLKDIPRDVTECYDTILASNEIYLNDNRKKTMERFARRK